MLLFRGFFEHHARLLRAVHVHECSPSLIRVTDVAIPFIYARHEYTLIYCYCTGLAISFAQISGLSCIKSIYNVNYSYLIYYGIECTGLRNVHGLKIRWAT